MLAKLSDSFAACSPGSRAPLENLKTVNVTNSLGFGVASTYNYADANSPERVTSISVPNAVSTDTFVYDRRNRGLVVQHKLNASQAVPQDSYEYDSQNRLISIAHLGTKLEMLDYDGVGDLSSRTFPAGSPDLSRYYVGDDLTLVDRGGAGNVGYAHIRLGGLRIASVYAKSGATSVTIYYHRDRRNDVVATTTSTSAAHGVMGLSYRYLPSGAIDKVIGPAGTAATETDTTASELGFIGGLKLSGGLVHLKARAYSPALRRFLQPDTLDARRYTYAFGDPLNFTDPSGRTPGQKIPVPTVTSGDGDRPCDGACEALTKGPASTGGIDWSGIGSAFGSLFKTLSGGTAADRPSYSVADSMGQLLGAFATSGGSGTLSAAPISGHVGALLAKGVMTTVMVGAAIALGTEASAAALVVGGVAGLASGAISGYLQMRRDPSKGWGDVASAAFFGAGQGVLGASVAVVGILPAVTVGAITGFGGSLIGQLGDSNTVDSSQMATDGLSGALSGGIAAAIPGSSLVQQIVSAPFALSSGTLAALVTNGP